MQIAGIKERLKLSSDQESYWPAVEKRAARDRPQDSLDQAGRSGRRHAADRSRTSEEVPQLKSAAMPLLFQLREDQKQEVRTLARIIGLERVASMI